MSRQDSDSNPNPYESPHEMGSVSDSAIVPVVRAYDRVFWLGYLANFLTTMANAMLVRYSDFVTELGGEEQQLGLIVGCGMVGSIVMRCFQGGAIDHYGAGRVWLFSQVLYTISLVLHLALSTAYGPAIFLVRTIMQASIAGVFGASITFVSLRVSPQRMAEMVGALGTSGFLGIMLGPLLSDWLANEGVSRQSMVGQMFSIAAMLAGVGVLITWLATFKTPPPVRHRRLSWFHVVARYHPWMISLTAAAMGAGFSIPMTFLSPFVEEKKLSNVGTFFLVYASSAFVARVASRSLFERYGNRPWIITGLLLLTASFLAYIPVTQTWHLVVPGLLAGVAHALLFPSIMAAGTAVFPRRYLGVATSLVLASFDIGTFVGAPVVGVFLREAKLHTTAAYPLMFAAVAVVMVSITLVFCVSSAAKKQQ